LIDKTPLSAKSIGELYGVDGRTLQRHYKDKLSDFKEWNELNTPQEYLIHPENVGEYLSIDETALSNGELYTVVTNKSGKGKSGSLVALIKGTQAQNVISHLLKIPSEVRGKVKEITLDMANTMITICKIAFPRAVQVTDRFHVQKLVYEAVQEIRIKYRWEALDAENEQLEISRKSGKPYKGEVLSNGDTRKQLLARSRHLLFKHHSKWTEQQRNRASVLFEQYPDLQHAYKLSIDLFNIYQKTRVKQIAYTKLARWYEDIEQSKFKTFNTVKRTVQHHYISILNYFDNRSTNASAESFNAKIKGFRAQFRGVRNIDFFLYRIEKLFA
jgi:transposase